jgi:hypothetical protein
MSSRVISKWNAESASILVVTRLGLVLTISGLAAGGSSGCRPRSEVKPALLSAADATANPDSPFELFAPRTWMPFASDQIMSQPSRAKFDLFQLNMSDFSQINGAFGAAIERQPNGVVLRSERWRLGVDVGPGALIQSAANAAIPLAIRIEGRREVTYTRAFASHQDAWRARPVSFADFPLDADRARRLAPGDFVSIPTNMGLTIGLEPLAAGRPFAVSCGVGAFWSGEFRINVYSQGEGYVRVKVSPSTARGIGAHAGVGARLSMFGYSPGKLINYDRQAERFFGLDFVSWSRTRVQAGERFAFDYIFNLNDPSARIAYDSLMSRTLKLKSGFRSLDIFRGRVNADLVIADLTPAEYLAGQDLRRPAKERRVARVFSGSDFYQSDTSAGRFGTRVFQFNADSSLTTSKIRVNGGSSDQGAHDPGDARHLTAIVFRASHGQRSWFSPLRENQIVSATAIFGSDPGFWRHALRDFRFEISFSQNDLTDRELRGIREAQQVVFGSYYDQLGLSAPQALNGSLAQFQSVGSFAADSVIFDALRNHVVNNEASSLTVLRQIAKNVITRFRGSRGEIELFRDVAASIARGELRDLDAEIGKPMVDLSMSLGRVSTSDYLGGMLKLMSRSAASRLIVAGFFADLSLALQKPVDVDIEETAHGAQPFVRRIGAELPTSDLDYLNQATYALTHMGYE